MSKDSSHLLVGGTGAIGVVYGYYLRLIGAKVGVYVRPKYLNQTKISLVRMNPLWMKQNILAFILTIFLLWGVSSFFPSSFFFRLVIMFLFGGIIFLSLVQIIRPYLSPGKDYFTHFHAISSVEEVAERKYDYIWLCISSTQIREGGGEWIRKIMESAKQQSPDVVLISLTPGLEDRNFLLSLFPFPNQLIMGMTSYISYQTDALSTTPAHHLALPSISLMLPPGGPALILAGDGPSAQNLSQIMNQAGLPSHSLKTNQLKQHSTPIATSLHILLLALEIHGWSWKSLAFNFKTLKKLSLGISEACQATSTHVGIKTPVLVPLIANPLILSMALLFAPLIFPFDLEKYIKYHFTKVGDQTIFMIEEAISLSKKYGVKYTNIDSLLSEVKRSREKNSEK